jgi:hypothetical protein
MRTFRLIDQFINNLLHDVCSTLWCRTHWMFDSLKSRPLTDAAIFLCAWGSWSGWSFLARDREGRFEEHELPPPVV